MNYPFKELLTQIERLSEETKYLQSVIDHQTEYIDKLLLQLKAISETALADKPLEKLITPQ